MLAVQNGTSMDLPQTAPGIPAPGVDPEVDELSSIDSIDAIFAWLGTAAPTVTAYKAVLGGGGNLKLRDIVYIGAQDYADACSGVRVPNTADPPVLRDALPLELGHFTMARRIARLRIGLTAVDATMVAAQAAGPAPGGPGGGAQLALGNGAAVMAGQLPPSAVIAEPRIKLSSVLDPTLDSELVRLPAVAIRKYFSDYITLRGATPSEDTEPTAEQLSAMHQVIAADLVPYGDFAVLGPHGRRLVVKLTYCSYTFLPDGSWQRRELPGPPSFDHWWACFRVLRTIFLLLGVVPPEIIDNYGEMVRSFHAMYGDAVWFLIYQADVLMRCEQFERIRRHVERQAAAGGTLQSFGMGGQTGNVFDPKKPWQAVFEFAVSDKLWWDEHLHRPAMLYLTKVRSAADVTADGTAQPTLVTPGGGGNPSAPLSEHRARSRSPMQRRRQRGAKQPNAAPHSDPAPPGTTYTTKGRRHCEAFNSPQGCPVRQASCPDVHNCKKCGRSGHPQGNCFGKDGGGKGKGGGKDDRGHGGGKDHGKGKGHGKWRK